MTRRGTLLLLGALLVQKNTTVDAALRPRDSLLRVRRGGGGAPEQRSKADIIKDMRKDLPKYTFDGSGPTSDALLWSIYTRAQETRNVQRTLVIVGCAVSSSALLAGVFQCRNQVQISILRDLIFIFGQSRRAFEADHTCRDENFFKFFLDFFYIFYF